MCVFLGSVEIILKHDIQLKIWVRMSSQASEGEIVPLMPKTLLCVGFLFLPHKEV